jgi:hypothetical protein
MQEIQLLKDLADLKSKYIEGSSQTTIDGWMKRAKDALIVDGLKEHKGIQIIIENCEKEIEQINRVLLNARGKGFSLSRQYKMEYVLGDYERELLLDRRAMYEQFLSIFADASQTIASITNQVNEQNGE